MTSISTAPFSSASTLKPASTDSAKRLRHRDPFGRVRRGRPVLKIGLDQKHLGPDAAEVHDDAFAQLAAIQSDIVRAQTIGQRRQEENILIELADLQIHAPRFRVPEERKQAIHRLHARAEVMDRRSGFRISGKKNGGEQKQHSGNISKRNRGIHHPR